MDIIVSTAKGLEDVAGSAYYTAVKASKNRESLGLSLPDRCRVHIGYYPRLGASASAGGKTITYGLIPCALSESACSESSKRLIHLLSSFCDSVRDHIPNGADTHLLDAVNNPTLIPTYSRSLKDKFRFSMPNRALEKATFLSESIKKFQLEGLVDSVREAVSLYFSRSSLPFFDHELDHIDAHTYAFYQSSFLRAELRNKVKTVETKSECDALTTEISNNISDAIFRHVYLEARAMLVEEAVNGRNNDESLSRVRDVVDSYVDRSWLIGAVHSYFISYANCGEIDLETSRLLSLLGKNLADFTMKQIDHPIVNQAREEFFDDYATMCSSKIDEIVPLVADTLWNRPHLFEEVRDAETLEEHLDLLAS